MLSDRKFYQNTSICFFGHTNLPMVFTRDEQVRGGPLSELRVKCGCKYFVNVGSVGEPRDGSSTASYVVYERGQGLITLHRVCYDQTKTEAKAREAGLPLRRACQSNVGAAI